MDNTLEKKRARGRLLREKAPTSWAHLVVILHEFWALLPL